MKQFFLFLIFVITCNSFAQTKRVSIHVDVLGKRHKTVRYYHPINGDYKINSKDFNFEKRSLAGTESFCLVQPALTLNDSNNFIKANSLRHYLDPSELVYVDWRMGNDTSNFERIDSFIKESQLLRDEKYQTIVEDYFNPFFMSKYEITNGEYKAFVNWVKDSIFREAIYYSEDITDEQAFSFLIVPGEEYYNEETLSWEKVSIEDRGLNRDLFNLNYSFDYRKELGDTAVLQITSKLYLPSNERFYRRSKIDIKQLSYRYYSVDMEAVKLFESNDTIKKRGTRGLRAHKDRSKFIVDHELEIYPDTLCWFNGGDWNIFNSAMVNLYFWHPAYDNFPVVGVSYLQAKAFCHWKQKQLEKLNPELAKMVEFDLPNLKEYEWAISIEKSEYERSKIQDNELITDLLIGGEWENEVPADFSYSSSFTDRVFNPYDKNSKKERKAIRKKLNRNHFFHDTPDDLLITRSEENYLANGISFLSNNVSEWMNEDYKKHYEALFTAYVNYHCLADPFYCENQRNIDQNNNRFNDSFGQLIIGGNWYDERYDIFMGINRGGLYAKTFQSKNSKHATVGFRCVLRLNEN